MRRLLTTFLGAGAALALAACGPDESPGPGATDSSATASVAASPTGTSASPTPSESSSAAPVPLDLSSLKIAGFTADGGRVACLFDSGGPAAAVRCDVPQNTWATPPRPKDCHGDWGLAAGLTVGGPGELLCVGDTVFGVRKQTDGSRELAPGTLATYDRLACLIQDTGVSCYDTGSGGQHSLFVNTHTYEVI